MFRSSYTRFQTATKRLFTTAAAPEAYSTGVQVLHWSMGGSMLACVGLVLAAQNTKDKQEKIISKDPAPIVGAARWEAIAATTSHYAMYIFIIGLPFTGVFMGAYSGYGLPFFYTTIPSIQKEPTIAKKAYEIHKVLGQAFEYFVPLHVGGAFYHVIKGHTIFPRIIGVAGKAAPKA